LLPRLVKSPKKLKAPFGQYLAALLLAGSTKESRMGFLFMNHSFDVSYAKKYGVDEAIMICNFQYWLKKNWANDKHRHDGRTWTYNSVASFEKLFPYWTGKQIRRILDSLVSHGVLMRGEYNKSVYDRTSWYAFVDESTFLFENLDLPKWETQEDYLGEPIPNINTYINTNTVIPPLSPKGENVRIDYKGMDKAVEAWLKYKAEKNQKYKSSSSIQTMVNKLWRFSKGNPDKAIEIVESSMAMNYTGFFEPKENGSAPASKPSAPRKSKVKYYDTDFPDRVRVATREEYNLLVSGNPDSTFVITQEYFD